jgi:hypothetical protein
MIKQYLQGRSYNERVKAKAAKKEAEDDSSGDSDSDSFDPRAALDEEGESSSSGSDDEPMDDAAPTNSKRADLEQGGDEESEGEGINPVSPEKTGCTEQRPIVAPDTDPLAVFMDEDGFFLDYKGVVLETKYDGTLDSYKLQDGHSLNLDDLPASLDKYNEGFEDGKYHVQNVSGHWRVGSIIRIKNMFSPRSRMVRATQTSTGSSQLPHTSASITSVVPTKAKAIAVVTSTSPSRCSLTKSKLTSVTNTIPQTPISSIQKTQAVSPAPSSALSELPSPKALLSTPRTHQPEPKNSKTAATKLRISLKRKPQSIDEDSPREEKPVKVINIIPVQSRFQLS